MLIDLTESTSAAMKSLRHTSPISPLLIVLSICACLLGGCGGAVTGSPDPVAGVTAQGLVLGGQQPVTGAKIYLYAAGSVGYGSASISLLNAAASGVSTDSSGKGYILTDNAGRFDLTGDWRCAAGTDQVYLLSLGGNPGLPLAADNTALALMTVLGTCDELASTNPKLVIDEVTTVASVWALRPFMMDALHIGASATNLAGLTHAFAQVPNIVDTATGQALTSIPAKGTLPQRKINTLANLLAPCVNSASGASAACGSLFATATPPAELQAADTIAAARYIANNPGHQVSALFLLGSATPPFQPQLAHAPDDWMLFVTYRGGGLNKPTSLEVDGSGNVWVANYAGGVSAFSSLGMPLAAGGYTGGGLNESFGLAIDARDNLWISNEQSTGGVNSNLGTITKLSPGGEPLSGNSGYDSGGIYFPVAVAADPNGNMWVVDYGDSKVTLVDSAGLPLSGEVGWGGTSLDFPVAVAVDSRHNAWVANQATDAITKISADGSHTSIVHCCDGASGIAIDQRDNAWVTNYYGDSISEVSSSGSVLLNSVAGGGLLHPQGIALDGSGTIWVANYRGNSISALSGAASEAPGTFLSPASGFGKDASLLEPYGLALDGSGNAWVSNFGNNTVTEFLGIATPIRTPLLGPPSLP